MSHSQHGEDRLLIATVFKGVKDGFFVDIGAYDGRMLSNTYAFEQRGWTGICVEPEQAAFSKLVKNRRNSICLNYAVSNVDEGEAELLVSTAGCSRLKESYRKLDPTFKIERPALRTLDSILMDHKVEPGFQLLNIDVEGYETRVLDKFTLGYYKPQIVIIEDWPAARLSGLKKSYPGYQEMKAVLDEWGPGYKVFFEERGYLCAGNRDINFIWCRDEHDYELLRRFM